MKHKIIALILCLSVVSSTIIQSSALAASEADDDKQHPLASLLLQRQQQQQRQTKADKEDPENDDDDNEDVDLSKNPLTQFFLEGAEATAHKASNDGVVDIDWGASFATQVPIPLDPIPSPAPTTSEPSSVAPSPSPTTKAPTKRPISSRPTVSPTTMTPSQSPTLKPTTQSPSKKPSQIPTLSPTTKEPSSHPTSSPIAPVSIGGIIYSDVNENGVKDRTENGVGGIIIKAKSCTNDRLVGHAFSKSNGSYILRDIGDPGCYYLQFVDSEKYYFSTPENGRTENIELQSGEVALGYNAGVVFYPTNNPTISPSLLPTLVPSASPTTIMPSKMPSQSPVTSSPTNRPSLSPVTSSPTTSNPTLSPSLSPSFAPSFKPTHMPSKSPSMSPTRKDSDGDGVFDTDEEENGTNPYAADTDGDSLNDGAENSLGTNPMEKDTDGDGLSDGVDPNPLQKEPTAGPTKVPTLSPSLSPSELPTLSPSDFPTSSPSREPSLSPTTYIPTSSPSVSPTTNMPSKMPSQRPVTLTPTTFDPTVSPSAKPATSKPSNEPTLSPSTKEPTTDLPTLATNIPLTKLTLHPTSNSPSSRPSTPMPSRSPITSNPSSNPTDEPSTKTPSKRPSRQPSLRPSTSKPSKLTSLPSKQPVTTSPTTDEPTKVELNQNTVATDAPTDTTAEPTKEPASFWFQTPPSNTPSKSPVVSVTNRPTMAPVLITSQPTEDLLALDISELPNMKFTLLETDGDLSNEAVADLTNALDTFYNTKLAGHYNKDGEYFQAINLTPGGDQASTLQSINDEPERNLRHGVVTRRNEEVLGTEILYDGSAEFVGNAPSANEIVDMILLVSKEYNNELVSTIVGTENVELGNVFIVKVEKDVIADVSAQTPSLSPSSMKENYLKNNNSDGINSDVTLDKPNTAMVIMMVAGVATLTMLLFVFATRSRRDDNAGHFPTSKHSGIELNLNNDADMSVMSSVNEWDSSCDDNSTARRHGAFSFNEMEASAKTTKRSGGLQSAAAINHIGTKTLEKEDDSIMPRSWLNALHGDNSSVITSQQDAGHALEALSGDDSSNEVLSDNNNHGAFPRVHANSHPDWSDIGTSSEEDSNTLDPSALDIEQVLSADNTEGTGKTASSLNRFISDLVWLEQKIADDSRKEEVTSKEESLNIQITDSLSYECDEFSPRSNSDDDSTVTSLTNTNSNAMSIVCRDVFIPPGKLEIDLVSTKDGVVISNINDDALAGHLNVGELIMSLDDRDCRSVSADQLAATLSSRSGCQRKLTLLHFGAAGKVSSTSSSVI